MLDVGVLTLLCSPLLHDPFPGVQIPALSTLSKLAGKVGGIAGAVTEMGVLEMLLKAMWHSNRGVRKAANTAMQSVASAGEECAEACVHCGALDAIHASVQNYDADVTEEAVKTLSIILTTKQDLTGVAMTEQLTACLVNLLGAGGICPNLKNLAASLIGNMCAHSEELAERARGLNALTELAGVARDLGAPQKLRSTALGSLSQAAAHSDSLTVAVLKTRVLPAALAALTDPSPGMRKSSSVLLQSIVQKSAEMADAVDKSGGIPCLVANVIEDGRNGAALSAVLSLGHMAAFRHTYAQRIVSADGGRVLANQLHGCEVAPTSPSGRSIPTEEVDTFKQAIAWTLMQIGCQVAHPG